MTGSTVCRSLNGLVFNEMSDLGVTIVSFLTCIMTGLLTRSAVL